MTNNKSSIGKDKKVKYITAKNALSGFLKEIVFVLDELKDEPFKVSNEDLKMTLYQKYFKQLPEDCQNILKLTARDIPQKEIAQALNFKSENYVNKRKHNCKDKLIEMIKKDPQYPDLWDETDT